MTVPITGSVKDVTGVEDNDTPWSFASVIRFAEDGSVITEKPREVRAVSGNLKVNLVPGYAIVTYGKHVWQVTVPETPTTLKALIEAGVAYPPDTAQELLTAAVAEIAPALVADELQAQTADAVDADLASRSIGFVDEGSGTGHFTVGGVPVSGTLVPPAATWSGLVARPNLEEVSGEWRFDDPLKVTNPDTGLRVSTFFGLQAGVGEAVTPFWQNSLIDGSTIDPAKITTAHSEYVAHAVMATFKGGFSNLHPTRVGSVSSGSTALTVASDYPAWVVPGCFVHIPGAGSGGSLLRTRITAISGTSVTLSDAASTTVSGVSVMASSVQNPTFLFGTNNFFQTGGAAGDLDTIKNVYGTLMEVHLYTPSVSLDVFKAAQSEAQLEASSSGTVGIVQAHHIRGVLNHGTATITNAYGLYIDKTAPANTTNAWSFYVAGGRSRLIGRTTVAAEAATDVALTVQAALSQSAAVFQVLDVTGGNRVAAIRPSGAFSSSSYLTAFEGVAGHTAIGSQLGYPGIGFGLSNDVRWGMTSAGVTRFITGKSAAVPNSATADRVTAANAGVGGMYWDTTDGKLKVSDGTNWYPITVGAAA